MKQLLKKHGIAALVLGILWFISWLITENMHGGIDYIGNAIMASTLYVLLMGAFFLNLLLLLVNVLVYYSPKKGKILISYVLLAVYGIGVLLTIWNAFSFSYGRFFQYLKEGEFFSILHVLFLFILLIMILIRYFKLKKYQKMR